MELSIKKDSNYFLDFLMLIPLNKEAEKVKNVCLDFLLLAFLIYSSVQENKNEPWRERKKSSTDSEL